MRKLYIICGLPGAGKTTFAKALSKKLNIVCLFKDSIKEGLYDIRKTTTLDENKVLGKESIQLLYKLAEEQLSLGVDLIIESPFYFEEDYPMFRRWEKEFDLKIYTVICSIDLEIRLKRFKERERHLSHCDADRELNVNMKTDVYEKLPGVHINVKTDKPVEELVESVFELIK